MSNIPKKTGRLKEKPKTVGKVTSGRTGRIICHDEIFGEEESRIFAEKSEKVYQESMRLKKELKLRML
jgi:phosphoribosylaminoimidazole-succinocarboxamide synthase